MTIKVISAELGLPAEERYWHRVSLIYRPAADAAGIKRPKGPAAKTAKNQHLPQPHRESATARALRLEEGRSHERCLPRLRQARHGR
jgi:hypothetical protein